MPTKHRRYSVTETPPLRRALDALRARGQSPSLTELALEGAERRLEDVEDDREPARRRAELGERLAERMRSGEGIDTGALDELRSSGWTRA